MEDKEVYDIGDFIEALNEIVENKEEENEN